MSGSASRLTVNAARLPALAALKLSNGPPHPHHAHLAALASLREGRPGFRLTPHTPSPFPSGVPSRRPPRPGGTPTPCRMWNLEHPLPKKNQKVFPVPSPGKPHQDHCPRWGSLAQVWTPRWIEGHTKLFIHSKEISMRTSPSRSARQLWAEVRLQLEEKGAGSGAVDVEGRLACSLCLAWKGTGETCRWAELCGRPRASLACLLPPAQCVHRKGGSQRDSQQGILLSGFAPGSHHNHTWEDCGMRHGRPALFLRR